MAREFNMELINYSYSNGITATAAHIPRTPPPSPPPQEINKYCRLPPLNLQDIPEFLLCKTNFKFQKTISLGTVGIFYHPQIPPSHTTEKRNLQ